MRVDDDSSRLRKRYAAVDVLFLFAVVRDLIVTKPVHPMYLYGLPLTMIGQTAATYIYLSGWPA